MINLMKASVPLCLLIGLAALVECNYEREKFKKIVLHDNSNDDAIDMTAQQLITRSGFFYEEHYVASEDGYISQLVRLVNPLVKREDLRKPPVAIFHGGNIDMTCYLSASSKQHHPETWPRGEQDPPTTSSKRSLGFALANEGFDVWLIGTRGSNEANQGFTRSPLVLGEIRRGNVAVMQDKKLYEFAKTKAYWQYGLDDIISYEIGAQLDKVKQVTGSEELSVISFSLSTPTTLAYLTSHPEQARSVKSFIQLGPSIDADHFTLVGRVYFEKVCPKLPTRGRGFFPSYSLQPIARKAILELAKSPELRYSLLLGVITSLFGPSPKYQTNLERNILAHVFQPVSFKSVQHYCQSSVAPKEFAKFDYKTEGNLQHYNQPTPPKYDISNLEVQHWALVSGGFDGLADPTTVERLKARVHTPSPVEHIVAPGFNHLDLIAAVEVDRYVNEPIADVLARHSN